jgi:hypothetical protein
MIPPLRSWVSQFMSDADNHLATSISAVNLEDRLGNVETDCRDRLHA